MATKKVGVLVKEARTAANLTQEALAKKAKNGLTANDISKCERGEADLTATQLKEIAKACGVTQTSLVNAPKNVSASAAKKTATSAKKPAAKAPAKKTETAAKKTTAKKTETTAKKMAAKTTAAKTTTTKKPAAKKTETTAKKTTAKTTTAKKPAVPAGANTSMKVTASEKKLIEAYRGASSDLKKIALKVLKGEYGDTVTKLLGAGAGAGDGLGEMLGDLVGGIFGGKK